MGLSFGSLGKKIHDILGGAVGTVNRDVVQPIVHPNQNPNNVLSAPRQFVGGLAGGLVDTARTPFDAARVAMMSPVMRNPNAPASAKQHYTDAANQLQHDTSTIIGGLRAPGRTVAGLAVGISNPASYFHPSNQGNVNRLLLGQDRTYTPDNAAARFVFGKEPISSYSHEYNTMRNSHTSLPVALSHLGTRAVGDALAIKGGVETLKGGAHALDRGAEAVDRVNTGLGQEGRLNGKAGDFMEQSGSTPIKPKVSLTNHDKAMGEALGMTTDQTKQAKATATAPPKELPRMTPEEVMLANKQALESSPGYPGSKAPQRVNTAANPIKINLRTPEPGNYKQAIVNSQVVSRPLKTAGDLWNHAMSKLSKDEETNFWRSVENPANPTHSASLRAAIDAWRNVDDRAHAGSQAVGGNTNYLHDHALHPWDLPENWDGKNMGSGSFSGLNNKNRIHRTIAEGEAAGLTLSTDPIKEGNNYIRGAASTLRKEALKNGLSLADRAQEAKPHTLDLGGGHTVPLSKEGFKRAGHLQYSPASTRLAVRGVRAVNRTAKTSLLSLSQFHPLNISTLRAAPTLALEGHPIAAAKGLYRTFRAAFGSEYADHVVGKALRDGTVEKAARIGMPYGASEWTDAGAVVKRGVGEHTVFGKQMPMMHDQVARSIIADLEKRNIPLDSPEALRAGKVGNNLMGFVNDEMQGISAKQRRAMGDWLLAGQYTPAKLGIVRDSARGGVAGSYARAANVANIAATTAVIAGVGYLVKQKSDNARDMLIRALLDPAIPTPFKDQKGNTLKFRLPGTNMSDLAKLVGIEAVRQPDGHLGISWKPSNLTQTLPDWARARLSPLAGTAVKIATNTNFSQKKLYDPNAPLGTKAEQAAFTLATGDLPIGLQGVAYTKVVKDHLPGAVREIADYQTPGTNPVAKSAASSFGFSPAVDQTVGKGLQDSTYFNAADEAKGALKTTQAKNALDRWIGSKKNPVTGSYDTPPNVNDSRTKATALLDNPTSLDALFNMNQKLAAAGGKVDPLWLRSKDQVVKYLQYQAMPPKGPDQADWNNKNPWYIKELQPARSEFYNSLPPGDPNKPNAPIEYPTPAPAVKNLMDNYFKLTESAQKGQFMKAHPDLQTQFDKQDTYWNQLREAQGYAANKTYPKADAGTQKFIDSYMAADKATRAGIRNSDPTGYQHMAAYFTKVDLYGLGKEAGVNALQGEPDTTQKELKNISNISQDIYKNPDGSLVLAPAGWLNGMTPASGGGSYTRHMTSAQARRRSPSAYLVKGKGAAVKKRVAKVGNPGKPKISSKGGPKVSIKKSLV